VNGSGVKRLPVVSKSLNVHSVTVCSIHYLAMGAEMVDLTDMHVASALIDRKSNDKEVAHLRAAVAAAFDELLMVLAFYQAWLPAATDQKLMERLGESRAAQAFEVIRLALQREVVLGLMRLWDKNPDAVKIMSMRELLRGKDFIRRLIADRSARLNMRSTHVSERLAEKLVPQYKDLVRAINEYMPGRPKHDIYKRMRDIRDQRLAHRQVEGEAGGLPGVLKHEIDTMMKDTVHIVHTLADTVGGVWFDPEQAGAMYRDNAQLFWNSVKGEKTPGHPDYSGP